LLVLPRHQPTTAGFEVQTSQGSILCDYLVNAAGMHAPLLAHSMRFYPKAAIPPVYFAKGNYFKLQGVSVKDTPFHRLVYPIPAAGGLGVHATLDMQGAVKFGPNVEWLRYAPAPAAAAAGGGGAPGPAADPADPYRFPEGALPPADFGVNPVTVAAEGAQPEDTLDVFCREIARYWPAVRRDLLVPDYAGIRPKLCGPGPSAKVASAQNAASGAAGTNPAEASFSASRLAPAPAPPQPAVPAYSMPASADFAVLGRAQHGVPGLVCLFGVESPGLTASLAIADHARDLLLQ
jgi:glycine/D-amino acid oxidase-like deaminating enzyme